MLLVESIILVFALGVLVSIVGLFFSKKSFTSSEKLSPFECGFSSKSSHRSLFSIQFFLVCLVFIIFDVELVILFPLLAELPYVFSHTEICFFILVVFILTLGLMWEWSTGMLEWMM